MEAQSKIISTTIIPAIMPKDFADLEFKASNIKDVVPRAQIDIMDGVFVQSLSWPFHKPSKGVMLKDEDRAHEPDHVDINFRKMQSEEMGLPFWEKLDYDVDLMVENPAKAVMEWAKVGVHRVILHLREDNTNDITVAIEVAKEYSLEISLALLPGEISPKLKEFIFEKHIGDITGIQCMGIEKVGYQNQEFAPKVFDTIREILAELHKYNEKLHAAAQAQAGSETQNAGAAVAEKNLEISVDGGVDHENARPLYDAGVDKLISGHAIFESHSPAQEIEFFEDVLG